jgi:hypothetical protein
MAFLLILRVPREPFPFSGSATLPNIAVEYRVLLLAKRSVQPNLTTDIQA